MRLTVAITQRGVSHEKVSKLRTRNWVQLMAENGGTNYGDFRVEINYLCSLKYAVLKDHTIS